MNINKNIAATMKLAMKERNQTLAEFAAGLGIGRTSLQGYLNEFYSMRSDTIEYISSQLGMTPAEFISGPGLPKGLPEGYRPIHPLLAPVVAEFNRMRECVLNISEALYMLEEEIETINDHPNKQ